MNRDPSIEVDSNTIFMVNFTWDIMLNQAVVKHYESNWMDSNYTILTHTFDQINSYVIRLTATNAITAITVEIDVEVEQDVTHLDIRPNATAVNTSSTVYMEAIMDTGTNPVYAWKLDGVDYHQTAGSFEHTFPSPGTYVFEVTASNEVSTMTKNITILVEDPINDVLLHPDSSLNLSQPYITEGTVATIKANVSSGSDPEYSWHVVTPSYQTTFPDVTYS